MEITSLEAFVAVARFRSFSRASEQLFLTQPAVSKRVASLECELGVELFNRIARQVSLTEAGEQLLPKAQELINQAEDMQRYANNLHSEVSGVLSVSISHHIALHRMPPILKEFNRRYDNAKLDIRFEDSEQAYNAVEQGDIEFAVITLPSELPDNLVVEAAWHDDLYVVAARDHELVRERKSGLKSLADYSAVLPSSETEMYRIVDRQFTEQGLRLNTLMNTNNLETLKMLAIAGVGWTLLPKNMLSEELVTVSINRPLSRRLGLVYHKKRSLSNTAKALKDLILN